MRTQYRNEKDASAAKIIAAHYGLTKPVSPAMVKAEIDNLKRKAAGGRLDDFSGPLAAALQIGCAPTGRVPRMD